MTQDTSDEYADEEILNLIAALNLAGPDSDLNLPTASLPQTPPQTPSHRPPPYTTRSTFRPQPETRDSPGTSTLYYYESPTRHGYTPEWWSAAGNATQGISGGHVHVVQQRGPRKNKKKKTGSWRAYVVFCGRQCGVFLTCTSPTIFIVVTSQWLRPTPLLSTPERSWTRVADAAFVGPPIPALPVPLGINDDHQNPLNGSETLDDFCKSQNSQQPLNLLLVLSLECQLNTLGVSGAVHESVKGKIAAYANTPWPWRRAMLVSSLLLIIRSSNSSP
ncbi:hypothetical protein B0H13DRAFT_1891595 [Mycena leptocephala]|nr:hypothetical protein B0H13DRAFT_1891595 [Mycena leptocephala]